LVDKVAVVELTNDSLWSLFRTPSLTFKLSALQ